MKSTLTVRNITETSFIIVKDGIVSEVSEQLTDMIEYSAKELLCEDVKDIFSILRIGPSFNFQNIDTNTDYFLFTKSLEVRFVYFQVINESDKQIYILREKPNSRLEDCFRYLYTQISENAAEVFIYSVPDFILLSASERALNLFDAPYNIPANAFGKPIGELVTDRKGRTYEAVWRELALTGKAKYVKEYQYDNFQRGITYWDTMLTPIKHKGRVKYLVVNCQEVTERVLNRKKLEEQNETIKFQKKQLVTSIHGLSDYITLIDKNMNIVNDKNEQLQAVIESMSDALVIINPDGTYKYCNKRSHDMAYQGEKIVKHGDSTIHTNYYDINGRLLNKEELPSSRVLKGEKIDNVIIKAVRPDKTTYLSFNGNPAYDAEGKIMSAAVCIRDMTQYVQKERALEENQLKLLKMENERNNELQKAIEMKDEFLSIISHELRTPLNVISTAMQAINYFSKDELSDKTKEYMSMIRQNTNRQLRLVNNLLDITRANAGRINVNKSNKDIVLLTRAITLSVCNYALQKGITLTFEAAFEKKIIAIDEEKYERILLNLLSNAIKFTKSGKSIKVLVGVKKGYICIKIKDEGIGIPEEKIDLIFEKFGQVNSSLSRQAEGAGIGLSLVKKFVHALGGNISVESKVSKGSTFTILFPDERIVEEDLKQLEMDFMDNHLVEVTKVEFSDIYL